MVGKSRGGLIAAIGRPVIVQANILHVAQDMALGVLRHGLAQMRAEAEIGDAALPLRPAVDRHAAHQDEAPAVQRRLVDLVDQALERGHLEICRSDVGNVYAGFVQRLQRRCNRVDLGLVQRAYRPRLGSRFELPREVVGVAPSPNQFGHLTAEFRRIG